MIKINEGSMKAPSNNLQIAREGCLLLSTKKKTDNTSVPRLYLRRSRFNLRLGLIRKFSSSSVSICLAIPSHYTKPLCGKCKTCPLCSFTNRLYATSVLPGTQARATIIAHAIVSKYTMDYRCTDRKNRRPWPSRFLPRGRLAR